MLIPTTTNTNEAEYLASVGAEKLRIVENKARTMIHQCQINDVRAFLTTELGSPSGAEFILKSIQLRK